MTNEQKTTLLNAILGVCRFVENDSSANGYDSIEELKYKLGKTKVASIIRGIIENEIRDSERADYGFQIDSSLMGFDRLRDSGEDK